MALPVAIGLSPLAAAGAIFLGMAGSVTPDYADLRSDLRRVLRHRGFSHSVFFSAATVALVYTMLTALSDIDDVRFRLHSELIAPLTGAFALGVVSHLVLDAATPGGIRPLLPFSHVRVRVLPPGLRIPTGSARDHLLHMLTSLGVFLGVLYLVYEHIR